MSTLLAESTSWTTDSHLPSLYLHPQIEYCKSLSRLMGTPVNSPSPHFEMSPQHCPAMPISWIHSFPQPTTMTGSVLVPSKPWHCFPLSPSSILPTFTPPLSFSEYNFASYATEKLEAIRWELHTLLGFFPHGKIESHHQPLQPLVRISFWLHWNLS